MPADPAKIREQRPQPGLVQKADARLKDAVASHDARSSAESTGWLSGWQCRNEPGCRVSWQNGVGIERQHERTSSEAASPVRTA